MRWLPFWPALCGQFHANVQTISTSICAVNKVTERALELQQTFEKVAILSLTPEVDEC
jgi:hypothetical protein